ncbi:ubiquitin carboxyl-terminal hydrolase 2-like [Hydractinia symbiolongicarpus]|uniref:ubiquitin carboxyl-terminal hydrolase 2-like n=1 Tax=Hydractinia symbiolongicarpus TaxID=13093 RepID=UPI00254D9AFC|nr:ubiquitin carboxyl-terminal hydrolase 2-like [Hydractinia symbiolongicarpus]
MVNDWQVDFFAVEVGARGYCARTTTACLKRMGFTNKLAYSTANDLGKISMRSSFCIWLARESNVWSTDSLMQLPKSKQALPIVETKGVSSRRKGPSKKVSQNKNDTQPISVYKNIGFLNKGNSCYANAILQVLSTIPTLWCQSGSESFHLSPIARSISLNMAKLKQSLSPVDPSNFLWALERQMHSDGKLDFQFNTQQDVAEILFVVLDALKGFSPIAADKISTEISMSVSCNTCLCTSVNVEMQDILTLPMTSKIQSCVSKFLEPEILTDGNKWFCPQCFAHRESTRETQISRSSEILFLHLKRFLKHGEHLVKDNRVVECVSLRDSLLQLPLVSDTDTMFNQNYSLLATINHSGTLTAGHYWAYVKDPATNSWYHCNDRAVCKCSPPILNNNSCYILCYVRC